MEEEIFNEIDLENDCCPECGDDIYVLTKCNDQDGSFFDGDTVKCRDCDFVSCVNVYEDGYTIPT
jgi:hypothetical protein